MIELMNDNLPLQFCGVLVAVATTLAASNPIMRLIEHLQAGGALELSALPAAVALA